MKRMGKMTAVVVAVLTVALLAGLLLLPSLTPPVSGQEESTPPEVQGELISPNTYRDEYVVYGTGGGYELLLNEVQVTMALRDTATDELLPLVPADADSDTMASTDQLNVLRSHLNIVYSDSSDIQGTMNTFKDSIDKKQYTIHRLSDGVRVTYTLGTAPDARIIIAQQMSAAAFDELIAKLSANERAVKRLKFFYSFITIQGKDDDQKADILEYYPCAEKGDLYAIKELSDREKKEIVGYYTEAGYTLEDIDAIYEELGFEEEAEDKPYFKIPVEYRMQDGRFAVQIMAEEIDFDDTAYYLETITLLPYFGAAKHQGGFIFIPDGCGSLIRFGEGISYTKLYTTGKVYGDDISVDQTPDNLTFRLPVFGIKSGERAMFADITGGESYVSITAQVGNIIDEYDTVYPVFTYQYKFSTQLKDQSVERLSWTIFAKKPNRDTYRVEYDLLKDGKTDIGDMAAVYRNKLFGDREVVAYDDIPLYMSTLGSINLNKNFMGIAYSTDVALTTFDDVKTMTDELKEAGIRNTWVRMLGWYNGGLNYTAPASISPQKVLGGKDGYRELMEAAKADNALTLLPTVDLGFVRATGWFDGFSHTKNAARTLDGKIAAKKSYNFALCRLNDIGVTTLLPQTATEYLPKINAFFDKNGQEGLAVLGLGSDVFGSYLKSRFVRREQSQQTYESMLEQLSSNKLMLEGGNAYALPFADAVLDISYDDSNYPDFGERVAFMQMVLYGNVGYAVGDINLSEDARVQTLRCIELGAFPSFTMAYRNLADLRSDPNHSRYFAVGYEAQKARMIESYTAINEVLSRVSGCRMTLHRQLAENVFETVYDNGVCIRVNYGKEAYTAEDGVVTESLDYTVCEEGAV